MNEKPPEPMVGRMVERDGATHAVFDKGEVEAWIDRLPDDCYTDDDAGETARWFDEAEARERAWQDEIDANLQRAAEALTWIMYR